MITKPQFKVKHKIEDLICFIEKNDLEGVKKILGHESRLLQATKMDDNEPVYYAIKYKMNKIFKYILDNSKEITYDLNKLLTSIINQGTEKMLRHFINCYKIDLQSPLYKSYVQQILEDKKFKMIDVIINETNLQYSFRISPKAYVTLQYNFKYSPRINDQHVDVVMNKNSNSDDVVSLDNYYTGEDKFNLIFLRYKKIFLVMGKSLIKPKNLKFKDYQQLLKYM